MNQREYFGFGSIQNLSQLLRESKPKKIFLVTGKESYHKSGASSDITRYLGDYDVISFRDFSAIPLLQDVEKGIAKFRKKGCDLVIAVGGGSVIDVAKLVNILAHQDGSPIEYVKQIKKIERPSKPLIAIPTTAGSGSEATHFAVVYVEEEKFSVASEYILPTYCIIDPNFTMNLPPMISATSGMDALCQAIESYWSINATFQSRELSKKAIILILNNLVDAVNNPTREARLSMCEASNLAGKAINISKTTAPHAISYPLTYYFGIPHGHAVGLTLGEFLVLNGNINEENAAGGLVLRDYKRAFSELLQALGVSDTISAKQKISKLMKDIGLDTRLSRLNIDTENFEKILHNVNIERLNNNPRILTQDDLRDVLKAIF